MALAVLIVVMSAMDLVANAFRLVRDEFREFNVADKGEGTARPVSASMGGDPWKPAISGLSARLLGKRATSNSWF